MNRILAAAAMLALAACNPAAKFRNGLPTRNQVEVKLPTSTTTQKVSSMSSPLQGDIAGSYQLTRGATQGVNGATLFVLGLVKAITDNHPTTITETEAVWGPHAGDALDPNMWKLTVTKGTGTTYSYALEGKGKNAPDTAWVVILSGSHDPAAAQGYGSGTFLVDFDAAQTLPEHGADVGTVQVDYARAQGTGVVTVAAQFVDVNDGNGGRGNFSYGYSATPNQGGTFDFITWSNLVTASAALEKLTVHSRWMQTGAGRSDYQVTDGDLASAATGNECWDTNFASQYVSLSFDPTAGYGVEATDCVFPAAEYSSP